MKKSKNKKKNSQATPKEELAIHTEQEAETSLAPIEKKNITEIEKHPCEKESATEEKAEESAENKALTLEENNAPLKVKPKESSDSMTDEEAYLVLGPQSILGHLLQLVLAPIPLISVLFTFLWISFGGTMLSVGLVSGAGALVLAVFAFWAFGGCANVNRRRFARAYFLSLAVITAATALFVLLALSYGADLSPVLRKIINSISSLNS